MKSHDEDAALDALLEEYSVAKSPWPQTDEEIDALLENPAEAIPYTDAERAERVKAVLRACGETLPPGHGEQLALFRDEDGAGAPRPRQSDLFEIVRLAYRDVHDGWSSDRVVADPYLDARFIQACWHRGAQAPQALLNHLLLNARKRKILGKTDGARRYHIDPAVMDQYLFASEFAARIMQDRQYANSQRRITVDHILCDPELAREFDEIAKTIAPGFSSLDYRWAAFALRKAKSRDPKVETPTFSWLGRFDSIRPSQVSPVEGVFWIKTTGIHVYVGHSQNLRNQIDRLLQVRVEQVVSNLPLFQVPQGEHLELGIAEQPDSSVTSREPIRNRLIGEWQPRLNILLPIDVPGAA